MAEPAAEQQEQELDAQAPAEGQEPEGDSVSVRPVEFAPLEGQPEADQQEKASTLSVEVLLDVEVPVVVELGHTEMPLKEILALKPGAIVELDRLAGEPADIVIRGHVVAQGEIIVVDDNFGVRITNIVDPKERLRNLH